MYNENISKPIAVRYDWADNPDDANLYNKEGSDIKSEELNPIIIACSTKYHITLGIKVGGSLCYCHSIKQYSVCNNLYYLSMVKTNNS